MHGKIRAIRLVIDRRENRAKSGVEAPILWQQGDQPLVRQLISSLLPTSRQPMRLDLNRIVLQMSYLSFENLLNPSERT